jgi:hypothetical protein
VEPVSPDFGILPVILVYSVEAFIGANRPNCEAPARINSDASVARVGSLAPQPAECLRLSASGALPVNSNVVFVGDYHSRSARTHYSSEYSFPDVSRRTWESAQQPDDGRAELEWLANESRHYTGEWVALDGNRLVAHGPKLAAVKAAAQAAGVSRPFFASVPDDDLLFGGW